MRGYLPVEELEVYKLAEQLADAVWDVVIQWDSFARDALGLQLVRAVDSVGANIAEGGGDGGRAENRRFVRYARRSLKEARWHLRRAYARGLINDADVNRLQPIVTKLSPMLSAYYRSLKPMTEPLNDSTTQPINRSAEHP